MHALVLAGGEGSRLAADGVSAAKPFVELRGRPQLLRLADTLRRLGCESVTVMLRTAADVHGTLAPLPAGLPDTLSVHPCATPSSLHTLVLGLRHAPPGPVFCSMVDTVMPWRDWQRVFAAARDALAEGADAVLAVTGYVADDRPLTVLRDADGAIQAIEDRHIPGAAVTGGVYAFAPIARAAAERALASGADRMRFFLRRLVEDGYRLRAVEVPRIVDLDHRSDLAAAEALLGTDDA